MHDNLYQFNTLLKDVLKGNLYAKLNHMHLNCRVFPCSQNVLYQALAAFLYCQTRQPIFEPHHMISLSVTYPKPSHNLQRSFLRQRYSSTQLQAHKHKQQFFDTQIQNDLGFYYLGTSLSHLSFIESHLYFISFYKLAIYYQVNHRSIILASFHLISIHQDNPNLNTHHQDNQINNQHMTSRENQEM